MFTIAVAIQKGGSGKSTTTINAGAGLARAGKKVLLIDLDPQANLTLGLGVHSPGLTINDVLAGVCSLEEATLQQVHGLDLVPASLDLAAAELNLINRMNRERILARCLQALSSSYDLCLIDCPPSLGILTLNALAAAQAVIMPMQAEFFPAKGASLFSLTMEQVRSSELNPELELLGVLLTQYDTRKVMHREVLELLLEQYGELVFSTAIRQNIALVEAAANGLPIFEYAPESNGAQDYLSLVQEILERMPQ